MLRFITFSRRGLFFFKRVRIGLRILKNSFQAITFEHRYYYKFCILFALIKLGRIYFTSSIDPSISRSILITEYLADQTFFEVLFDYVKKPTSFSNFFLIFKKSALYGIELLLIYVTSIALIYFHTAHIQNKYLSEIECFKKSVLKINLLIPWIFINMGIEASTALLSWVGDILYFTWSIATVFMLQIIAFEKHSFWYLIAKAFSVFKNRFGNIIGVDLLSDLIIILISAFFYYIFQAQIIGPLGFFENLNYPLIISTFYLIAIVSAAEIMSFTFIYLRFIPKKM